MSLADYATDMSPRELKTLCLTCQGQGQLVIARARITRNGRVTADTEATDCWYCKGEGWLRQAITRF
jgi:DnaJ-class molecular chaperone